MSLRRSTSDRPALAGARSLAAALALGALVACKDTAPKAVPPADEPAAPTVARPDARPRPTRPAEPTAPAGHATQPITPAEATAAAPTFAGAELTTEATSILDGRQVRLAWCVAAPDHAAAVEAVRAGFVRDGWSEPVVRGTAPRVGVAATRDGYRLSVTVADMPRPGCSPADGRWYAAGSMHKLGAIAPTP
ncbi:MAG: hypothetical protein R2939_10900 [Kofleriaceae bacterium]